MIGCDIAKIDRFEKFVDDEKFLQKYFSLVEQKYINSKTSKEQKMQTLAGLYACKEAVLKAFQIGIGGGTKLCEVEIEHNELGAPVLVINQKMQLLLEKFGKKNVSVSISHDGEYAFAVCMIE